MDKVIIASFVKNHLIIYKKMLPIFNILFPRKAHRLWLREITKRDFFHSRQCKI